MKKYIYRKEYFGYTKYDPATMTHTFVDEVDPRDCQKLIELPKEKYLKNGNLIAPIRVYIETTLNCNLSCPYCFNIVGAHGNLNTEDMLKSIDLFHRSGVIDLRFTGGEITTRKDWPVLLQRAKDLGFVFSVNTNGTYSNKKIIENFVRLRPNQITISVDGIGDRHDETRGKGSFAKVVSTLKALNKEGLNLRINCTLTKKNADQIDGIIELAQKYCSDLNFFGLREIGEGRKYGNSLSFEEFNAISSYVNTKSTESLYVCGGHLIMKSMSILDNDWDLNKGSPDLTTRFNITSDGTYYSGGYLPFVSKKLALGNVMDSEDSLYQTWHFSEKMNEIREASSKLKEICGGCTEYGQRCNGGIFELELEKHFTGKSNPYCIHNLDIFQESAHFSEV